MIDEMKEAKLPEPIFENKRDDFVVKFYNGEYPELYPKELIELNEVYEKKEKNTRNAQETYKKRIRNTQEKFILEFCNEERSLKEIAEYCGYRNVRTFRENYINPLLKENKIKMTIPEQPKNRNQKYVKQ